MNQTKLCIKHFHGTTGTSFTGDDTRCKFCRQELLKEMARFGIYDWKSIVEEEKEKFISK